MTNITIKKFEEMDRYEGEYDSGQKFIYAGKSMGVSAWGMNVIEMPPNWADYPDHNHAEDGQEEVYVVLAGSGYVQAGDERLPIGAGMMVRVSAEQNRKLIPGDDGMTVLALGGTPGKAYTPPSW
ncbi:MAG: cupin domain-containing protein [Methylococcales bacterium]|nr:cupin domain-containing protein [Methylococcales bacterium]